MISEDKLKAEKKSFKFSNIRSNNFNPSKKKRNKNKNKKIQNRLEFLIRS